MLYEYDIFISYSHRDNIAQQENDGWVDCFHAGLYRYVTEALGRTVKIWRDKIKMQANDRLNPAVYESLPKCMIFIPILSPNFMNSQWCPKELDFFYNENKSKGGAGHIFPVSKIPVQSPPPLLSDNFLKYEFVKRDKFGEIAHHLDPSFGSAFESEFYLKVSDMSREIAKFITNYVETDTEAAPGQAPSAAQPKVLPEETEEQDDAQEAQPLIYLAEPSPDLWDQYNEIKRDLEQREIKFLPANLNPLTRKLRFREDYKKQVLEDVKKCRLAVHLIGKENNFYPAEGKPSYLHLQTGVVNEYAGDPESNPDFKRLIWFPKDAQSDDEEHHTFIEEIRAKASGKIEFLQNSLEDFKSNIQDGLKPPPAPPPEPPPEDPPWVYVVYHKGDLDMAYDVEDYLQNQGYAIFPARDYLALDTDGSAEKLEINKKIADDTHKDYLLKCDGVLIYWNSAPTSWVRNSIFELQGIKPDRNRNFRANAVFCDGDIEAADKVRFRPPLPNLFKVIYPPLNNTLKQKVVYPPLNSAFKKNGYSEFPDFLSRLEVQN